LEQKEFLARQKAKKAFSGKRPYANLLERKRANSGGNLALVIWAAAAGGQEKRFGKKENPLSTKRKARDSREKVPLWIAGNERRGKRLIESLEEKIFSRGVGVGQSPREKKGRVFLSEGGASNRRSGSWPTYWGGLSPEKNVIFFQEERRGNGYRKAFLFPKGKEVR